MASETILELRKPPHARPVATVDDWPDVADEGKRPSFPRPAPPVVLDLPPLNMSPDGAAIDALKKLRASWPRRRAASIACVRRLPTRLKLHAITTART